MFECNKKEFLRKYVTVDETWIQHIIPESNQLSAEWTAAGENSPKRPKTQTSGGKFLASVFRDSQDILFIDFLEKMRSINSKYYKSLLVHLKEQITKNLPQMKKKYLFTKTLRRVTSQSQRWKNYVNCNLNCFHNQPILHIWPTATTGCLQTTKTMIQRKRIWLQRRSDIWKGSVLWCQRHIVLQKSHRIFREALESEYHSRRKTKLMCWWIKSNFALKLFY